jgi:hypothetical protein
MHMGRKSSGKVGRVRTTITLDPDVARMLEALQRERGVGLSEAVNDIVRAGAPPRATAARFVQRTSPIGITGPACTGDILGMDDDVRFPAAGTG